VRAAWWAGLVVVGACGRLGFDERSLDPDAVIDPDALADGATDDATMLDGGPDGQSLCTEGPIDQGTQSFTLDGTSALTGSCGGGSAPEVILAFDAPAGAHIWVTADEPDPGPDTVLYLFPACPLDGTAELDCDQEAGSNDGSMIDFEVVASGRYYAVVDGEQSTTGLAVTAHVDVLLPLGATCVGVPSYWRCGPDLGCADQCVPQFKGPKGTFMATNLTISDTTTTALNLSAGGCAARNSAGVLAPEHMYRINVTTPISNLNLTTDSVNTDFDTVLYIRTAVDGPNLVCADDISTNNKASNIDTGPLAIGSYFVYVDGFSHREGNFDLQLTVTP
jgi:hypothetical protein